MAEMNMEGEQKEMESLEQILALVQGLIEAQKAEMAGGEEAPGEEAPAEAAPVAGKKPSFADKLGAAIKGGQPQ